MAKSKTEEQTAGVVEVISNILKQEGVASAGEDHNAVPGAKENVARMLGYFTGSAEDITYIPELGMESLRELLTVETMSASGRQEIVNVVNDFTTGTLKEQIEKVKHEADLYALVKEGNVKEVEQKLNEHPDVNLDLQYKGENTLLHVAAQKGHVDIIKLLHTKGADINSINDDCPETSGTPVYQAVENGHVEAVRVLLALQAKVDNEYDENREREKRAREDLSAKYKLSHNSELDHTLCDRKPILVCACEKMFDNKENILEKTKYEEIANLLLDAGVKVNYSGFDDARISKSGIIRNSRIMGRSGEYSAEYFAKGANSPRIVEKIRQAKGNKMALEPGVLEAKEIAKGVLMPETSEPAAGTSKTETLVSRRNSSTSPNRGMY